MQVIKPFSLGLQTRSIEYRRRIGLCITAQVYFPFAPKGEGTAWTEMSMWNFLGKEMPQGPLIDEGVAKTTPEYLVHGSAYAPGGRAGACEVRVRVGALKKRLRVFGPRYWNGKEISAPLPFERVPIDWAHAYGGSDFAPNPAGMGRDVSELRGTRVRLLPQVELAAQPITAPDQAVEPASLGLIDLTRPQRSRYQGTYGEHWLQEQSPGFADDLDWRFFNLAPADQWFDAPLAGDEPFAFTHMHPDKPQVGGHLPGLRARCFVNRGTADAPRLHEAPLKLTTAWFFPHAERGILLFQGLVSCVEDDASDISLLMGALERIGDPRSEAHYAEALARRLDPRLGGLQSLRESDLMPTGLKGSDPDFEQMQQDYRPGGLMAEAQRRGAMLRLQIARDEAKAQGVDPDALGLLMPAPQLTPTLEELPDYVATQQAAALNAQVSAALDAAEQIARARATAKRHGIDPDSLVHRGPPTYRAEAHLKDIQAQVPAGAKGPDGKPLVDVPVLARRLAQVEAMERSAYLAAAHTQPPARPVGPERAALLRDTVQRAHAKGQSFFAADLTGADLSGMDLRGADFTAAWLESANLQGALLQGCSFACAVLAHADLSAADATEADFGQANLGKARLHTTRFVRANLAGVNFSDTALAQTDLRQATLHHARLLGASFGLADWRGVQAEGLVFHRATLTGLVLHQAQLVQPQFIECDLSGADFSAARLDRPSFVHCTGRGTRFTKADLRGAVFVQSCDFSQADFAGARLAGSNLRGTRLTGASLRAAELDRCDLSDAALDGADLGGATLRGALMVKSSLRAAVLAEANLMEAVVQRADLRGADLRGSNLFQADLSRVHTDPGTALAGALLQRAKTHPRRAPERAGGASP